MPSNPSALPMTASLETDFRSAWAMALVAVIVRGDPVPSAHLRAAAAQRHAQILGEELDSLVQILDG